MADKYVVRSTRSGTSGHGGGTATMASSVQDRMRLLRESYGFSFAEAQAALTPDPRIPRPGADTHKIKVFKLSGDDPADKAQFSSLAKVKTTHRRPAQGSESHSPRPRTHIRFEEQHQSSPRTQEHLFGRSVATYPGFSAGKITFMAPDPATGNAVEDVSDDCGSCGGECVYSVPLQKHTGIQSKTPRGDKVTAHTDTWLARAQAKRGRTVASHFPVDPGLTGVAPAPHPRRNTSFKTETLPLTINEKPARNSRARLNKPAHAMSSTRSTCSSLAEAGSQNSEQSKPRSLPAFANEAISQAASAHKKTDIIKAMNLGHEWDVVGKNEAGEEDWLAVDVDETTAKIKFMTIEVEKL